MAGGLQRENRVKNPRHGDRRGDDDVAYFAGVSTRWRGCYGNACTQVQRRLDRCNTYVGTGGIRVEVGASSYVKIWARRDGNVDGV